MDHIGSRACGLELRGEQSCNYSNTRLSLQRSEPRLRSGHTEDTVTGTGIIMAGTAIATIPTGAITGIITMIAGITSAGIIPRTTTRRRRRTSTRRLRAST